MLSGVSTNSPGIFVVLSPTNVSAAAPEARTRSAARIDAVVTSRILGLESRRPVVAGVPAACMDWIPYPVGRSPLGTRIRAPSQRRSVVVGWTGRRGSGRLGDHGARQVE